METKLKSSQMHLGAGVFCINLSKLRVISIERFSRNSLLWDTRCRFLRYNELTPSKHVSNGILRRKNLKCLCYKRSHLRTDYLC